MIRVMMQDSAYPGGAGPVLLNLDLVVWMGAHPVETDKTMARLLNGEVLLILAPFDDIAREFEA